MRVIILVADEAMENIHDLATTLGAKGLVQPNVLESIGVITGQCDGGQMEELGAVDGVKSIAEDGQIFAAQG